MVKKREAVPRTTLSLVGSMEDCPLTKWRNRWEDKIVEIDLTVMLDEGGGAQMTTGKLTFEEQRRLHDAKTEKRKGRYKFKRRKQQSNGEIGTFGMGYCAEEEEIDDSYIHVN